jgi:hypothetical protein
MKFFLSPTWRPIGEEEVKFHSILASALGGGECYTARPVERTACMCWIGIWLGHRAVLDAFKEREISFPLSILHRIPKNFAHFLRYDGEPGIEQSVSRLGDRLDGTEVESWQREDIFSSPKFRTYCRAHRSSHYRYPCSVPVIKGPTTSGTNLRLLLNFLRYNDFQKCYEIHSSLQSRENWVTFPCGWRKRSLKVIILFRLVPREEYLVLWLILYGFNGVIL